MSSPTKVRFIYQSLFAMNTAPRDLLVYKPDRRALKQFDVELFNVAINANLPQMRSLMAQLVTGPGRNNRVGNRVRVVRITIRGTIQSVALANPANLTNVSAVARLSLFYDAASNGQSQVYPYSEIYQGLDPTGATFTGALALQNANNFDRFDVIREWFFNLPPNSGMGAGGAPLGNEAGRASDTGIWTINESYNVNYETVYDNAGTCRTGDLFFFTDTNLSTAISEWLFVGIARVEFMDG